MFKAFRVILSIFVLTAFAAFWVVGQVPGLHVHKARPFVFHKDGICHHKDQHHSDFDGFPSKDSDDDNCLICHFAQGFHSLASAPVDVVLYQPVFVVPVSQSSFKLSAVSFDHASRAPPLG